MTSKTRKQPQSDQVDAILDSYQKLEVYQYLLLTRECDDALLRLYKQGKMVGGAYTSNGNEATAIGSAYALEPQDYLLPMHRDLGAHLVKGQTLKNVFLQHLAREAGLTRGRDGTGHYADPAKKIYGNVSHLAAMIPIGVGIALGAKMKKENAVVLNYIGEGGCNVGDFHEGLNMAAVMKLPFVLIIENNQFAYSTPSSKQYAAAKLSDRGIGYGIPAVTIDGMNVEDVYHSCREAFARARGGDGPTLIESMTARIHGHSASDDAKYVPTATLEAWKKRDPLFTFEKSLIDEGILTDSQKDEIKNSVVTDVEEAVAFALESPNPIGNTAVEGVYAS